MKFRYLIKTVFVMLLLTSLSIVGYGQNKSSDNVGTFYTTQSKVQAALTGQGIMHKKGETVKVDSGDGTSMSIIAKGSPYVSYLLKSKADIIKVLLSISFIKKASDTGELISLEILDIGYYELNQGNWKLIIWGDDFTKEMYDEIETKITLLEGKKEGERVPVKKNMSYSKETSNDAIYLRTDHQDSFTYVIYKATSKASAIEFLKTKPVTKSLYYIVVETPEGNWARDKDGIYKE